jgi:hypothetical protein
MVKILRLNAESANEQLPPVHYLKFTQEEFTSFLANPTGTLAANGHTAKNLTITIKDHVWDATKNTWITEGTDMMLMNLPPAQNWVWWCGYQDEMCVCERVLAL